MIQTDLRPRVASLPRTASYRRRILLAVTGLPPQVVTETLYALAIGREDPFIPTEIHVITTSEGTQRIRQSLFSDRPGWFYRLLLLQKAK